MIQALTEDHHEDDHGRALGGLTTGPGLSIEWAGPYGFTDGDEPTGACVETVAMAAASRLAYLQTKRQLTAGEERALEHLDAAMAALAP